MEEQNEGFLPPEPPGPEPDLGEPAAQPPPPPPPPPPPQPAYPQPPAYPGWQQPPPGYPPPPPPPGYYAWAPPPIPAEPDNGEPDNGEPDNGWESGAPRYAPDPDTGMGGSGIEGHSGPSPDTGSGTSLTAAGAGVGMFFSRRGKDKAEAGETKKHKDLATAGWWVGIAVVVLSVLSTVAWVLLIVLSANSSSFPDHMKHDLQDSQASGGPHLGLAAIGLAARLVS